MGGRQQIVHPAHVEQDAANRYCGVSFDILFYCADPARKIRRLRRLEPGANISQHKIFHGNVRVTYVRTNETGRSSRSDKKLPLSSRMQAPGAEGWNLARIPCCNCRDARALRSQPFSARPCPHAHKSHRSRRQGRLL